MHALYIFTLAVAVFLCVDALPYKQSNVANVHTIPLKKKSITRRSLRSTISKRVVENVEVDQQGDIAYFAEMTFGNQRFDIQLDTGSADLFVTSIDCNVPACDVKNKYDQNDDDDFVSLDKNFRAEYDEGIASGTSGTTTLEIGDLTIEAQEFGLANMLSDDFARDEFDGVMGMSLSAASENNQLTPITRLIQNNALDLPQFAIMLGRGEDDGDSELTIGGTNQARFTGDITWTGLVENNRGHWIIPLDDCIVNEQPSNFQDRNLNVDTGTSVIIVPIADARTIYDAIADSEEQDDGRFSLPCDSGDVISMRVNGVTWGMDPIDFIIEDGDDECFGAIEGGDTGIYLFNPFHVQNANKVNLRHIFFRIGHRMDSWCCIFKERI